MQQSKYYYHITKVVYSYNASHSYKGHFAIMFRNFENPPITDESLQAASASFTCAVHSALRGQRTLPVYAEMGLDVWRNVTYRKGVPSEHRGHMLLQKADMVKLAHLPSNWWYVANENGSGIQVDFPFKAKPVLSWSPKLFFKDTNGNMVAAKRYPREKICLNIIRKPFNSS